MQPAATTWQQPIPYGQTTSVDSVRRQTFATTSIVGTKRSYDDIHTTSKTHGGLQQHGSPGNCLQLPRPPRIVNRLNASCITPPAPTTPELTEAHIKSTASQQTERDPLLSLRHDRYGLPPRLVTNFEALGVRSIYPWQSACLLGKGFLEGTKNLIYTAPTGGGTSLVADVLMLKRVIEDPGKKAILVLPYVALVQEKLRWLRSITDGVSKNMTEDEADPKPNFYAPTRHIQVMGFVGGSRGKITWSDFDIAVCTIEKANALVNSAIEEGKIDQLGILVIDEMHMLDDESRGYIIELMGTKLMCLRQGIQTVGMSATMSNPKLLAGWLEAKYYVSNYRPIPVEEHLVYDNSIYPTANAKDFFRTASQLSGRAPGSTQKPAVASRVIHRPEHQDLANPVLNAVVALSVETSVQGFGALVFCGSRIGTERVAALVADSMPSDLPTNEVLDKRQDVLASLRALPNGYEATFNKTIPCGVGFHHAGLTVEERDIIAESYDKGILKVMIATCSLAAGINLPARRVILHGARMGRDLVGPAMLRQMRGRAGRKGKDEVGETYLCCVKADLEAVAELLEAEISPVASCLTPEKRGIKRAILEVVATRLANSRDTLEDYVRSSLLWQTHDHTSVLTMLDNAIAELLSTRLIEQPDPHHPSYEPTQLGSAIVASALTPEDGICIHAEMQRALQSFVMDSEMHSFYLFTPLPSPNQSSEIDWPTFRNHIETFSEPDIRAFQLIGISPSTVIRLAQSGAQLPEATAQQISVARTYRRAYIALQLRDLCNEIPIHDIALRYSVPRGQIQNLTQTCHGFAAGMIKFCERMGSSFSLLGVVLEHMLDRLRAGARADLLEMAQVAFVKSRMARILWENGFKSVRMLAEATVEDLVPIMMLAQRKKWKGGGKEAEEKLREKTKEKAEVIVGSAARVWQRMMLVELEG